ncbi:MAG TPA: hypothetical protein VD995_32760 [Azospirillum sp.]|nr:hypothetical protein [Azospirillum sp.]
MTIAPSFAEAPGQRRHRRPDQPVAGHSDIPTFDRHDAGMSFSGAARTALRGTPPMGRVLHMAATGVWAIRLGGRFVEVDGRNCWEDREDLATAAARAGVVLSDLVVDTGR